VGVLAPAARAAGCASGPIPDAQLRAAESQIVSLINAERTSRGLRALSVEGRLTSIARTHAGTMAAAGTIFHNQAFMGMIDELDASMLAENVGMACGVQQVHDAFMASASHRENILTGALTHVGLGAASDSSGRLFVVEGFAALSPPPPAPVAPAAVAPAPAPPAPKPVAPAPVAKAPQPVAEAVKPAAVATAPPVQPATAPPTAVSPAPVPTAVPVARPAPEMAPAMGSAAVDARVPVETLALALLLASMGLWAGFGRRPQLDPAWQRVAASLRQPAWQAARS
jgi:hypothetical protein